MAIVLQVEFLEKSLPQDNSLFICESEENICPTYLMRGQIMARESLWIPFWQKRNPASFETYLETLPPNEFLTFTLADVFRPGGSSIKRSNLRRFKISIGGQDAISAINSVHSPKAMTREVIWQKPKNSPENITLWLEWTSREWPRGILPCCRDKTINFLENNATAGHWWSSPTETVLFQKETGDCPQILITRRSTQVCLLHWVESSLLLVPALLHWLTYCG